MDFINTTGIVAGILEAGTTSLTGSMVVTLLFIFLVMLLIGLMFAIPLEYLSILVLPFALSIGAFYSNFLVPILIIIIYVSTLIAKNWIFR